MAAVLAGGITLLLYKRLRASTAQRQMTKIVAAAADLPMGVTLSAKDVTFIDWPSDVPLAGSLPKVESAIGRPLIQSVGAREPILQRDLGIEGSGIGLAAKIPPGMRATAVRSNEIVGVAGFLYPGSRVDVLVNLNNLQTGVTGPLTQTVLQDVEVLTAGQTIEPDPQGKPQQVNVVTLLVSPEDSQKLQLASGQGTIQFVLRNGTDNKDLQIRPTRLEQLVMTDKAPAPAVPGKKPIRRAPPPRQSVYVLEVIQGTKRTVEKF